jgi:N-acetylglucosaminyldiphosphoundecaprenol N-acetyl-beta-D-mannosaminyltransferase
MRETYPNVHLFGLDFFGGCLDDLLQKVHQHLSQKTYTKPLVIFTPNPEQIVLSQHDKNFLKDLQAADIRIADGTGLVVASRLRGEPPFLFERIPGVEVVRQMLTANTSDEKRILVIGGRAYDKKTIENWEMRNVEGLSSAELTALKKLSHSRSIFWLPGYENVSQPASHEEEKIKEVVSTVQPDIVFVAFGAPAQERFITEHLDLLKSSNVSVAMVVGGSFDFLTGKAKRAPEWAQQNGFEWLYRLVQEPYRWKRQLRLIEFMWLTFKMLLV